MDTSWISPIVVAVGVVYSIWRDGQRDAKRDATHEAVQRQHADWLRSHSKKIADAQETLREHGERIRGLEAVQGVARNGD